LKKTLRNSVQPILRQLYTRRVTDPKQVIDIIYFPEMADAEELPASGDDLEVGVPYDGLRLRQLGARFILHFQRYMHGRGHPDVTVYNELIFSFDQNAAKSDLAFRARQFLALITGTMFLPVDACQLEVCDQSLMLMIALN
jgi:hypothetical protein